uniref:V-type proton ATPase subunit G n=3 Tax=Neoaves TaxID=3078114 RepID=A0A674G948_TAEGU
MASQSQGIQQLLQAEKRAAEKVAEARKRKNRRLKQAKEEAQAEIEQYRLQREKEFKAKEAAALGSHGSCTTEVEKETQEKMSVIQQNFQKNREVVMSQLLSLVCDQTRDPRELPHKWLVLGGGQCPGSAGSQV